MDLHFEPFPFNFTFPFFVFEPVTFGRNLSFTGMDLYLCYVLALLTYRGKKLFI